MRARLLLFLCLGIALLASACGGKGLGTEPSGQAIDAAGGYNAVRYDPEDRWTPASWKGIDLGGATITSDSLRGSISVVNFWASWCPPCRVEQPALERVSQRYKDRGVRFLGVNIRDTKTNAIAHVEEFAVTYPSVFNPDSTISFKFRLREPPTTFVLDRSGRVAWRIIGETREADLTRILEDELSRVEPVALVTQSKEGVKRAIAGSAGILVAFFVGVISFFTPCILPLLPGYLSYVSGVSGEELEMEARRSRVLAGTLLFTLGFALVFTMLGFATGSITGAFGFLLGRGAERVAGAFVIVMGLAFLSTLYVRTLERWSRGQGARSGIGRGGLAVARLFGAERRLDVRPTVGVAGALPLGAAFAVGWVPCVGPGLATILTIAGGEGSGARGAALLLSFSFGFGVWFVLGGLAFRKATRAVAFLRRHMRSLTAVGGLFLLTIGVLLVTNQWAEVMAPLRRWARVFEPPI